MKRFSVYLALIAMGFFPVIGFSQNLTITKVGEWGTGNYEDVFIQGNYAYCAASEAGLDIIDITNSSHPCKVGNIDTPGSATRVCVKGNYAYLIDGEHSYEYTWIEGSGLQVIDITHPSCPILVKTYEIRFTEALYVRNNHVYVTAGDRLKIIDISTPNSPTLVADFGLTPSEHPIYSFAGLSIDVKGNYAYVVLRQSFSGEEEYFSALEIIDVSDPRAPRRVVIFRLAGCGREYPLALYVRGKYAYFMAKNCLTVLDISDPETPTEVGRCNGCGSSNYYNYKGDIKVDGNYAYLASGNYGLRVIDISNPISPTQVGNFDNLTGPDPIEGAVGIEVKGNDAYLASRVYGLQVIDISNKTSPVGIGFYNTSGNAAGLDFSGNYVYFAKSGNGLQVIDVSNPTSPTLEGNDDNNYAAQEVYTRGNYAYVSSHYDGLRIIDISSPASPVQVGDYDIVGNVPDIYVSGDYAYITATWGVHVVDVTDPASPTPVVILPTSTYGYVRGVYIIGNYAYISGWPSLKVVDVSNPASPAILGEYRTPGDAADVYVSGSYAYVASGRSGLLLIDVSDPALPTLVGHYDTPGDARAVDVSGSYAYVADGRNGLLLIDVSDPASPMLVESYDTPGNTCDVHVNGDYIYVADGESGKLLIFKVYDQTIFPIITPDHTKLTFASLADSLDGPGIQSIFISNSGGGTLSWSVSVDGDWLACSPSSGTNNGEVSVSVDTTGLSAGTYPGTITISAPDAINSPQTVKVLLTLYEPGQGAGPFGRYSTPIDGSIVSSSVPFTGWVLDDMGMENVQLFREEGGSLVYIGEAVFVEGARPDVELLYPWYPNNSKAGWGYMMLTNILPNGGNGTFKIHAIATDIEGNQVTLGTKTIICDNTNAVKPFGAIDTPEQGGTASGSSFVNFGWALAPQPNTIPTDGSSITVWVNGVPLGNPVYNQYREDIATLFPGYNNSNGAVGYFYLDTTKYKSGVHTIAWSVKDDAGNEDGIGSRYFTTWNTGGDKRSSNGSGRTTGGGVGREQACLFRESISEIPVDYYKPLRIKKGYNPDTDPVEVHPDDKGIIHFQIKELERLEIRFSKPALNLSPLPIGSFLDSERGVFYWQTGPGFVGNYRLVFIEKDKYGNKTKKDVWVTIVPKFSKQE